jgi:hypothetical protein
VQVCVEEGVCLGYGGLGRVGVRESVEHDEVVDDSVVADGGDVVTGGAELGGVRLALVPQYVCLVSDHQRFRQALELVEVGS